MHFVQTQSMFEAAHKDPAPHSCAWITVQVTFCDECDNRLDSPVTGIAYPPEWALAHQRALSTVKSFTMLRRVPRRGLLSNVWSPKHPLRFNSFAPLLPRAGSKTQQQAEFLSPLAAGLTGMSEGASEGARDEGHAGDTPEVPRKLVFEGRQEQVRLHLLTVVIASRILPCIATAFCPPGLASKSLTWSDLINASQCMQAAVAHPLSVAAIVPESARSRVCECDCAYDAEH